MRTIIIVCIILSIGIWLLGVHSWTERRSEMALGTACEITIIDMSVKKREQAFRDAFRLIRTSEASMSIFTEKSDVARINQSRGERVYVTPDVYFVVEKSLYFARLSNGAFDITILPLSELWGFGNDVKAPKHIVPSNRDIAQCLKRVGYEHIRLGKDNTGKGYVQCMVDGMAIDLGGIAKGYICDLVVTSLKRNDIHNALVNIGGTVYAYGRPFGRLAWKIGIRDPRNEHDIKRTISLYDAAISTSGDYEQYFMHEGKRYAHILNPKTGYPVEDILSVTVTAPSAMVADALSTGVFVMGVDEGIQLVNRLVDVESYIVYQEDNVAQTVHTDGFFSPVEK